MEDEFLKIKQHIDDFTQEEFDKMLFGCGIEIIKPSIESDYVKSLKEQQ